MISAKLTRLVFRMREGIELFGNFKRTELRKEWSDMAKKGVKVALTYFITLIIAFLVFGGLMYYLMNNVFLNQNNPPPVDYAELETDNDIAFTASDGQTLLLIADIDRKMSSSCFIIIKTLPEQRGLMIMTLPSDTYAAVGGAGNTIYEFYRTEGVLAAVKAAENSTGMEIDKYLKVNRQSLSVLTGVFGSVEFDIPYNLTHIDPNGEDIIIREGRVFLDAEMLRQVITFPAYRGGELERARRTSLVIAELIDKNVDSGFHSRIDGYFNTIINSDIDTDISIHDYNEHADALKHIAGNREKIVSVEIVTGKHDENGYFIIDPNFVMALDNLYGAN